MPMMRSGVARPLLRAGGFAALGASSYPMSFALSRTVDGLPGAGLFMLTLVLGVIAIGVSVSAILRAGLLKPARAHPKVARCRSCRRIREVRHDVWICDHCDRTAAFSQPR